MSALLMEMNRRNEQEINAYFDGARNGIRLYAVWKDGHQFVGCGRRLQDALEDLEAMRQTALVQLCESNES